MRKHTLSIASGAALCCGAFGHEAMPSADGLALGAWSFVVLCHGLAGFVTAGGIEAWRARSVHGVLICTALGMLWTLVQAGAAIAAFRLLAPPLSSAAAGWMLAISAPSMAMLTFLCAQADSRSSNERGP